MKHVQWSTILTSTSGSPVAQPLLRNGICTFHSRIHTDQNHDYIKKQTNYGLIYLLWDTVYSWCTYMCESNLREKIYV